jgi:hypothetical protein
MGAINRIFGFLILAIALQLVWNGATDFRAEQPSNWHHAFFHLNPPVPVAGA